MGFGRTAWGRVRLVRPLNCLLAALGVVAGTFLAAPDGSAPEIARVAAPMAAFLIAGFGNVLNDLRDVEVDRLAHPSRPLPSGQVGRRSAANWTAALLSMGLAASLLAGPMTFLFAVALVALLFLYELRLKRTGLAGNVAVAALTASTIVFGAVAAWPIWNYTTTWQVVAAAAAMAFLANLAREVAKDIEDVDADRGVRRTLPMLVGNQNAGLLAAGVAVVAVAASLPLFPAMQGGACDVWRSPSLWLVLSGDAAVLGGGMLAPSRPGWAQRLLKAGMALAVLGFLAWPLLNRTCPQGIP